MYAHRPRPRSARLALVAATLCALGASALSCSGGGGGNPAPDAGLGPDAGMWWTNLRELVIDPPMATLEGSPRMTSQQRFGVTAVFTDGRRLNVTNAVTYGLEPGDVGSVRDGVFTTSMIHGGVARLTARAGSVSAFAQVTVRWSASAVADGLPADLPTRFGAATPDPAPASAPAVLYPNTNPLVPPNIASLAVHWRAPTGAGEFYDLAFTNAMTDVHLYVRCAMTGTGCTAPVTPAVWRWIAENNRGTVAGLDVRVRALLASGRLGASAPVQIRFAPDDIEGGIYYWTAAGNANGIYRYNFLEGDRAPQAFYTQPDTPRNSAGEEHSCTGCHALSLDGTRVATVLGGSHVGDVVMVDVATRRVVTSKIERWAQLLSFSPDGQRLIASRDGAMRLLSSQTLDTMAPVDTGGLGTHPEWSPTDNGVVFTRPTAQRNSIWVERGEIAWLPRTGAAGFGPARSLVAGMAGENHYYPSVTPDGHYVVFNRSSCPGGDQSSDQCDAYDDPSAELWMVDTDQAAHTAVALANANARGPTDTAATLTNSWPRVSPFTTRLGNRRVYWVTFSSKRNYGVRLVGQDRPQLWMVAITVPESEVQGPLEGDPSYAAFWLPFQDINTGNHIAQWTRSVVAIGAPTPAPAR